MSASGHNRTLAMVGLRGFGEAVITIDYLSGRWLVAQPRSER
jgi:hypothetical protein